MIFHVHRERDNFPFPLRKCFLRKRLVAFHDLRALSLMLFLFSSALSEKSRNVKFRAPKRRDASFREIFTCHENFQALSRFVFSPSLSLSSRILSVCTCCVSKFPGHSFSQSSSLSRFRRSAAVVFSFFIFAVHSPVCFLSTLRKYPPRNQAARSR